MRNYLNTYNEKSLHSSIKKWYALPGDKMEVKVGNFIIDIVRDDILIEVQTKNFCALKDKLNALCQNHKVILLYPIAKEKWILKTNTHNEIISKRRSPKKGDFINIFDELIRIPNLICNENFSLTVLLIKEEEIRCDDGNGSYRRKGISIIDRKLIEVFESKTFNVKQDFEFFIPKDIKEPFSNKDLSNISNYSIVSARKLTYCLNSMGVISQVGKRGNEKLFSICNASTQ